MAIMQPGDNWLWFLAEISLSVLSLGCVWYLTIIGRDRKPRKQKRGESTIVTYGDGIQEDRAPIAKFLIWTYVLFGIWMVAYIVWTGIHGLY